MKNARMKTLAHISILMLGALLTMPVFAGADIQVNRYSFQPPAPPHYQTDLLSTVIDIAFPKTVVTVGDSIEYLVQRSGYRFVNTNDSSAAMALELPAVHRSIGPLPLRTAIGTVAGPVWLLQENPEKRTVWLERNSQFAGAGEVSSTTQFSVEDSAPEEIKHPLPATHTDWNLEPKRTLRSNFEAWTTHAGWQLQWNTDHDYMIDYSASYNGSLMYAIESVLEHYRSAPVPLTASFYTGNAVLLVEPASANR